MLKTILGVGVILTLGVAATYASVHFKRKSMLSADAVAAAAAAAKAVADAAAKAAAKAKAVADALENQNQAVNGADIAQLSVATTTPMTDYCCG